MSVRYLQRKEIDTAKWDACIAGADNSLIYAKIICLDALCDQWDAVVYGDYDHVMPLPWRRKWNIYYLYQPFFAASLGIFGKNISVGIVEEIIAAIPARYRYWDLDLNEGNPVRSLPTSSNIHFRDRKNLWVELHHNYDALHENYSRLAKRKLKKAAEAGINITPNADAVELIGQYRKQYSTTHRDIPAAGYQPLLSLVQQLPRENVKAYAAHFPNGKVAAFYLLLEDERYVYSVLGGSTDRGKEQGGFYAITDAALQDVAGSGKIFRFEGSDKPGIYFFNQQFGAQLHPYYHMRANFLPWPIRLLKPRS